MSSERVFRLMDFTEFTTNHECFVSEILDHHNQGLVKEAYRFVKILRTYNGSLANNSLLILNIFYHIC